MCLKQDYEKLIEENHKLKRDLNSKQCFISKILKQKKELNELVKLLFSELDQFQGIKAERFHLKTLKAKVRTAKEIFQLKCKILEQ